MNQAEKKLYQELCDFELDDLNSESPMSAKLAWAYDWSDLFTLRAMGEYKKFIFLAAIAERMVSPSSVIDCVWHYHLLYTYSYWVELCGKILKKSLHHYPGEMGGCDRYEYTIQLYQTYFGSPPKDIWESIPFHSMTLNRKNESWRMPNMVCWLKQI